MTKSEHSSSSGTTRSGIFATLERDDFLANEETPPTKKVKLENIGDSSDIAINRLSKKIEASRNGLADKKTFWGSMVEDHPNDEEINTTNSVRNIKLEAPERESSVTEESASDDIRKQSECSKPVMETNSGKDSSSVTSSVTTDTTQSENGAIIDNQINGATKENVGNESSVSSSLVSGEGFVVSNLEPPEPVDISEVSTCSSEVALNTECPRTDLVNPEIVSSAIVEEESAVSADSEEVVPEVASNEPDKIVEISDTIVEAVQAVTEPCSQSSEATAEDSCANDESNPIALSAAGHIDSSEGSESSFATTVLNLAETRHVDVANEKRREQEEASRLKAVAVESLESTTQLVVDKAQTTYARLANEKRQQQEDTARLKAEEAARLKAVAVESLTGTAHLVAKSGAHLLNQAESFGISTACETTPVCTTSTSAIDRYPVSSNSVLVSWRYWNSVDPDDPEVEQRRRNDIESTVTNVARNFESLRTYETYYSRLGKPMPESCDVPIFPPMTEEEDDVLRAPDEFSVPRTSITSDISEEAQRELTDPAVDMSASNPFALWAPEEPVTPIPVASHSASVNDRPDAVTFSASVPVSSVRNNLIEFTSYLPHVSNSNGSSQPSSVTTTPAISEQNQSAIQSESLGFNASNALISRLSNTQQSSNTYHVPVLSSGTVSNSSSSSCTTLLSSVISSVVLTNSIASVEPTLSQIPVSAPANSDSSSQSVVRIKDEPLDQEGVVQMERFGVTASLNQSSEENVHRSNAIVRSVPSVPESSNDGLDNQTATVQSQETSNAQPAGQSMSCTTELSHEEEHGDMSEQSMAEVIFFYVEYVLLDARERLETAGQR